MEVMASIFVHFIGDKIQNNEVIIKNLLRIFNDDLLLTYISLICLKHSLKFQHFLCYFLKRVYKSDRFVSFQLVSRFLFLQIPLS
jgi:hypothetical protein